MTVTKSKVLSVLRSRGQNDRADWVDRTMPDVIDTAKNSGLLGLLKLDAADLTEDAADLTEDAESAP